MTSYVNLNPFIPLADRSILADSNLKPVGELRIDATFMLIPMGSVSPYFWRDAVIRADSWSDFIAQTTH
jgi:hypothetical protein